MAKCNPFRGLYAPRHILKSPLKPPQLGDKVWATSNMMLSMTHSLVQYSMFVVASHQEPFFYDVRTPSVAPSSHIDYRPCNTFGQARDSSSKPVVLH
jgi:hypothetical protein